MLTKYINAVPTLVFIAVSTLLMDRNDIAADSLARCIGPLVYSYTKLRCNDRHTQGPLGILPDRITA